MFCSKILSSECSEYIVLSTASEIRGFNVNVTLYFTFSCTFLCLNVSVHSRRFYDNTYGIICLDKLKYPKVNEE